MVSGESVPMQGKDRRVLLLGIGNILWADEGFGVRAIEALNRGYRFGPGVTLMDGGTQGIYLVQHVQQADVLVVFDAIDYGLEPGTLRLVEGEAVPSFLGVRKMSLHQTGFQEVLAMASLLGSCPERMLLVGVQPAVLEDYGGSLSRPVRERIGPAVDAAIGWLRGLGITGQRRDTPLPAGARLTPPAIGLENYERGRPAPEEAPRLGDPRILLRGDVRFDPKPVAFDGRHYSVAVDQRRQD